MDVTIRQQFEQCIAELRQGTLTEQSLRRVLDQVDGSAAERQDLLYLQAGSTSLNADVIGMRIVQDGEVSDGPADPDDWPYQTVIDAIRDGWRIVKSRSWRSCCWLMGKSQEFRLMGGHGWPIPGDYSKLDKPYGVPAGVLED